MFCIISFNCMGLFFCIFVFLALSHLWLIFPLCCVFTKWGMSTREHHEERGQSEICLQLAAAEGLPQAVQTSRGNLWEGGDLSDAPWGCKSKKATPQCSSAPFHSSLFCHSRPVCCRALLKSDSLHRPLCFCQLLMQSYEVVLGEQHWDV